MFNLSKTERNVKHLDMAPIYEVTSDKETFKITVNGKLNVNKVVSMYFNAPEIDVKKRLETGTNGFMPEDDCIFWTREYNSAGTHVEIRVSSTKTLKTLTEECTADEEAYEDSREDHLEGIIHVITDSEFTAKNLANQIGFSICNTLNTKRSK